LYTDDAISCFDAILEKFSQAEKAPSHISKTQLKFSKFTGAVLN